MARPACCVAGPVRARGRRCRGLLAVAALAWGCGGAPDAASSSDVPVAPLGNMGADGMASGRGDPGTCTEVRLVALSELSGKSPGASNRASLDLRIDAATGAVKESRFSDAEALVELARLQLQRNDEQSDHDGENDAARGLKNAMRAVAVDPESTPARLVLALAVARSLASAPAHDRPHARAVVLGVVEMLGQAVGDRASGPVAATSHTLRGYAWLGRGEPARAAQAFGRALELDPEAVSAWVGRGHEARSRKDLATAAAAYEAALSHDPRDAVAMAGLEATRRCEGLLLPKGPLPSLSLPGLTRGPIAPPPPPPGRCPAAAAADPRSQPLCDGRRALAAARTADAVRQAAEQIVRGWQELSSACEAGEPICGSYVPAAMLEASRGMFAAGQVAKSIAIARMALRAPAPVLAQSNLGATVALEIADRYFRLGMLGPVAGYYERHAREAATAPTAAAARERAFVLDVAASDLEAAKRLAAAIAKGRAQAPARQAAAVWIAAELVHATRGPAAARSWLAPHEALLMAAGLDPQALFAEARSRRSSSSSAPLLTQAVASLASDGRWSPAHRRIAERATADGAPDPKR